MVAAALAVAGCGGGGGGAPTTTTGERTPAQLAAAATEALDAAKAAVDMVTVSADRAKVTDADAAIEKARAAVAAASGADSHTALSQRLETLKTSLANSKDERGKAQMTALKNASTALAAALKAIEADGDGSTVEQFTAATEALAALEKAVADATDLTDAQKKDYKEEVALANGPRLRERRVARIVRAITETEIAAAGEAVSSNAEDATAKIAAARTAIEGADIPDAEKGKLLAKVEEQEKALDRQKRIAEADMEMERRAMGKALHAAMGPPDAVPANAPAGTPLNALYNLATVPYYITRIADSGHDTSTVAADKGHRTDFRIDPAAGAGSFATADVHTAVFFRHGVHDKAMPRVAKTGVKPAVKTVVAEDRHEMDVGNEWYVTHYERTTGSGEAKVTDRVRVYNDRVGGPDRFRGHVIEWDAAAYFEANPKTWTGLGTYDKAKREVSLGTNIVDIMIASPVFDRRTGGAVGSVTLTPADGASPSDPTEVMVPGTYMGADGHYVCESACTIGRAVGGGPYGGYSLSANWRFVHKKGAKALLWDPDYMYFGWWARDDDDGMPAAVSAFYDVRGGGIDLATNGADLAGSATYEGPAVGQYAIHDPLNGKGDGGEFTATATLRAEFNTRSLNPQSGMSGTVDGFRLRSRSGIGAGEWRDPAGGWSVSLNKSEWVTGPIGHSPAYTSGSPKGHTDNKATTTWTVGGVKAAPAGSWVATLYDESSGTVAEGGDQSNHPTSAMGKFQAEHGGTHRMVGAFGARLQPE